MAKYSRHDNRNKKRNKHKQMTVNGYTKRLKFVGSDKKAYDEKHNISVSSSR